MNLSLSAAGFMAVLVISQSADAKTLEDVLKEKGVISEADYKEVVKSRPVSYKLGKGFTFTAPDEKFQLSLGGRVQARYTLTDREIDTSAAPDSSQWQVRRMKVWMNGYAYTKDLTYLLQVDFTQGNSVKLLDHAYMNYRIIDEVQVLGGQTKVPFGRQWLNSSGGLQFVDRSIVSDAFRPGYDPGVMLNGKVLGGMFTYNVGGYGGVGQSTVRSGNDNALAARVTFNPFGEMPYSESDLDDSPKPLLSIGANYFKDALLATRSGTTTTLETNNLNFTGTSGWLGKGISTFTTTEKLDIDMAGVDAAFKWLGMYAEAEYLLGQAEGKTSGKLLRGHGFFAHGGYCIIPETVEVAMRYSYFDPNRDRANDLISETQGAASYYFNKHNLKIQGDVTNSHDQSKGTDDMIYRLQAQVIF